MWRQLHGPLARKLIELLDARQYEQLVALIQEQRGNSEYADDAMLAALLSAILQIGLGCNQCLAQQLWHQEAYRMAAMHEQNLRQYLRDLLDLAITATGAASAQVESPNAESHLPGVASRRSDVASQPHQAHTTLPPTPVSSSLPPHPPQAEEVPLAPSLTMHADSLTTNHPGSAQDRSQRPTLTVYCLGMFRVYQDDEPIDDWVSRKAKTLFKYLVTYRERPIAKEVLMDTFWPDAAPDAARNNLNVAVYSLRQTLRKSRPDFSHVLYQNESYGFNPLLSIWVDVETFADQLKTAQQHERQGDMTAAVRAYRVALALYHGEFIAEDRYDEWLMPRRQQLQADYLTILDRLSSYYLDQHDYDTCIVLCTQLLAADPCQEAIHCRLMDCYDRQGQRYLALRQYYVCVESLARELDATPGQSTIELYERIRQRD